MMERLSHDLNLALEESNCGRQERRKFGLRRRTRSAGNLPAAVSVSIVEDGSSSSPPQAPLITQPLSDSDDPQHSVNTSSSLKSRHYCQIGNFESDSFNENFSPTRPANVRRKRKFKKIPVEYIDGKHSPPIEILTVTSEASAVPDTITLQTPGYAPVVNLNKHKNAVKPERNAFCGKRKWSHRDKDVCEMRERSFSGGCSSKSMFLKNDFRPKRYDLEKKKKEMVIQPGKIVLKSQNEGNKPSPINTPSLPGSSSFNFVYKNSSKNGSPTLSKMVGYKVQTDLPPFFTATTSSGKNGETKYHRKMKLLNKTHPLKSLRNPLQFDDSNSGMECTGNESSSLSSSDSDGVVTNDSDREGDDELTDWPGIEELKVFNKSLSFKSSKMAINNNSSQSVSNMPPPKKLRKEKFLPKSGFSTCKNKFKKKRVKIDSGNDDDAMMSDSKTIIDLDEEVVPRDRREILQPNSSFASFSDIKNAGVTGQNANETFFQSFQAFQERHNPEEPFNQTPRTNFSLQKTSSSDLNASERSPQSDYCSEHSAAAMTEVREIRAGCRRIRDERPGFLILSAANEQLSKFLQDSYQTELMLPSLADPEEAEKLESLAKLYSLELQLVMGHPVLRKTSNTMQAIEVEHSCSNLPTDHKRRCYGEEPDSLSLSDPSGNCIPRDNPANEESNIIPTPILRKNGFFTDTASRNSEFSSCLVDKSLLDPAKKGAVEIRNAQRGVYALELCSHFNKFEQLRQKTTSEKKLS